MIGRVGNDWETNEMMGREVNLLEIREMNGNRQNYWEKDLSIWRNYVCREEK